MMNNTVNPSFSREMAEVVREHSVHFIDAPVTGSKIQAEKAELLFWVGSTAQNFETYTPLFNLMGRKAVHAGTNGMGSSIKMVVQVLLANTMSSFAEAVAFGEALGIQQETLLSLLIGGPAAAPFLANKQRYFATDQYEVEFPLRWMHKDLHLASLSAYEVGAVLPGTNLTKEIFALAMQAGYGDQDFSALFKFMEAMA